MKTLIAAALLVLTCSVCEAGKYTADRRPVFGFDNAGTMWYGFEGTYGSMIMDTNGYMAYSTGRLYYSPQVYSRPAYRPQYQPAFSQPYRGYSPRFGNRPW